MREISLKIDGIAISALHVRGPRAAVMLIHGNSSCKEIFARQVANLQRRGHTLIVPDLPGHGRSENAKTPRTTYSFPGYAAVLTSLLEQLGIMDCHIVGWSLGGHIGLELWYRSSVVRSLLICGTPPIELSPQGARNGFVQSCAMDLAGARTFTARDVYSYGSAMLGEPLDRRRKLARMIARTDGNARFWMVKNGLAGIGVDESKAVRDCPRPLAVVVGSRDTFIKIDYLQGLTYRNLWLGRPVLLDAGHAPHWQKPRAFNKVMNAFIEAN